MLIELSDRDLEVIGKALAENAKALEGYIKWIDDLPMLPAREVAVANVRADALEARKLWLRLYDQKQKGR